MSNVAKLISVSSLGCLLAMSAGCVDSRGDKPKPAAPAKVEYHPDETQLSRLTLTPEAEKSLGISLAPVVSQVVQKHRTFGGELIVPPGKSLIVASPVAGIVGSDLAGGLPLPGAKITSGTEVLKVIPLLSPERDVPTPAEQVQMAGVKATLVAAQITAQGDVQRAKADSTAARITLDRGKKLFSDRAGSQRAVDDAQAILNVAETNLTAASERYTQLTSLLQVAEENPSKTPASQIQLRAPASGIIRNLSVSQGQQVVVGTALFEVLDTSSLWIRVPIYVDLLSLIPKNSSARVVPLQGAVKSELGHQEQLLAKPIEAPPTADPASSSVDLYFEVPNPQLDLRPGQRVGVELPMTEEIQAKIVPASSILYDINGGTWVYVAADEHQFQRKRVSVLWFDEGSAVLKDAPPEGTSVVVHGTAELFGTEFGAGK